MKRMILTVALCAISMSSFARGGGINSYGGLSSGSYHSHTSSYGSLSSSSSNDVHVKGYVKKDGTVVEPHMRSHQDSSYNNNWSTSPNINPYTGHMGTHSPTWNDQAPARNY